MPVLHRTYRLGWLTLKRHGVGGEETQGDIETRTHDFGSDRPRPRPRPPHWDTLEVCANFNFETAKLGPCAPWDLVQCQSMHLHRSQVGRATIPPPVWEARGSTQIPILKKKEEKGILHAHLTLLDVWQ